MKAFTISKADNGIRLNRYLERCVPSLSGALMYKYLRLKRIKVNGKRCEASTRLNEGDLVELYLNDELFRAEKKAPDYMQASDLLEIIYEDKNIALINKNAGVVCHSDNGGNRDSLVNRFLRRLTENGEYTPDNSVGFTPALCNRLDQGTSGLVIGAKNAKALREINDIIKNRYIEKKYLAVLCGTIKNGTYEAFLTKNEKDNKVRVTKGPNSDSKNIITSFVTLKVKNNLSLAEVGLVTGRPHQIRAHAAFLGAPVLGDLKYGNQTLNKKYALTRQLLCAYSLGFDLPDSYDGVLKYLDKKRFSIDNVPFTKEYF